MSTSPIIDERHFRIMCARQVSNDCVVEAEVISLDSTTGDDFTPRSTSAAEIWFRKQAWALHADGQATCGPCMERWNGGPPAPAAVDEISPERRSEYHVAMAEADAEEASDGE
jgi:hypothetical protein